MTPHDPNAVPILDVVDLLRKLRHKPPPEESEMATDQSKKSATTVAPVVGYNPATGFSVGVGLSSAFFRGDPATTNFSSLLASLRATTNGQLILSARVNALTADNRWRLVGDTRAYLTNQNTYGLGTNSASGLAVNMKYDYLRLYETVYKQVRPNLFAGVGLLYSNYSHIRPDPESPAAVPGSGFVAYSNEFGLNLGGQTSAGASVNALVDSRDSSINPSRGFYADLKYEIFLGGFLGAASAWQLSHSDLRTYVRLTKDSRQKVAFWFFADLVTGGIAPYFDLPATGDDTYGRSGRGYTQGRFRGERMLYGEIEYRWTITKNGLLGMVAFLNTETLSDRETDERLFDSFATGAGAGLRLMLSKRSKTNLCVDYGHGKGSSGVYVGLREAF
ncbi:MAG TPA: BamA/TamA family outer membrane protein [Vicinamibacteria bacterium]|nr:BamA/TamA family outer membrane protein [Vicinamibacteria bacterium]